VAGLLEGFGMGVNVRLDGGKYGKDYETRPMSAAEVGATVEAMEGIILPRGVTAQFNAIQADRIPGEAARYTFVEYMFAGKHRKTGRMLCLELGVNEPPLEEDIRVLNRALILAFVE
jgi:hypothetical protein